MPVFAVYDPKREISGGEISSQGKANRDGAVLSIWQPPVISEIPSKQYADRRIGCRKAAALVRANCPELVARDEAREGRVT
jgi:hypothetical protein